MSYSSTDDRVSDLRVAVQAIDSRLSAVEARTDQETHRAHSWMTSLAGRIDRLRADLACVKRQADQNETRIKMQAELLKWSAFAALIILGVWDKLPPPMRALLGGP